jgi:predicted RNA binding protein YcfA (HicA-like mRNA interferase family)
VSTKQPVVNAKQLIKALEKKGFIFSRQCGSHAIYKNKDNSRVSVPIHGKKDVPTGTLRQILMDTQISFEELKDLI